MINPKYRTPEQLSEETKISKIETASFLKKLKKKKPKKLDLIVHDLHNEAFDQFDCLECANCCKTLGPRITDKDIDRMAKFLRIKSSDFIAQYIKIDEDNDFIFNQSPCPFLMPDNYCMVYQQRPKACREYPHTDRKRFFQILDLSQKNCETCPVVCDIISELKKQNW